jgi:hypothetical protein
MGYKPTMKLKQLLLLSLLIACSEKETITPAFEPLEIRSQSFHFTYVRNDEVLSPTAEFELIGPVGQVFRGLADAIADIIFEENNEQIDIDPLTFYVPELDGLDLSKLVDMQINRVFIRLKNQDGPTKGSLGFIKKADVYIKPGFQKSPLSSVLDPSFESDPQDFYDDLRLPEDRLIGPEVPQDAELALSFNRDTNKLACAGRCLDMDVIPLDFKSFVLQGYTSYSIYLRLVIDAVPKEKLELESVIDFSIEAQLF